MLGLVLLHHKFRVYLYIPYLVQVVEIPDVAVPAWQHSASLAVTVTVTVTAVHARSAGEASSHRMPDIRWYKGYSKRS